MILVVMMDSFTFCRVSPAPFESLFHDRDLRGFYSRLVVVTPSQQTRQQPLLRLDVHLSLVRQLSPRYLNRDVPLSQSACHSQDNTVPKNTLQKKVYDKGPRRRFIHPTPQMDSFTFLLYLLHRSKHPHDRDLGSVPSRAKGT